MTFVRDAWYCAGFAAAWRYEDEPMIEACQRNMGTGARADINPRRGG